MAAITIPAGTPLSSENVGGVLKAEAVVLCDERDAWLIRVALKLPDVDQRVSTSVNHLEPEASMPVHAAALPVMSTITTLTLPAGTVCKRAGIPFTLRHATHIDCHPENWPLIRDGFTASIGGQALVCSQSVQGLDMPTVAQPCATSATTSSSSLESSTGFNKSRI